MNKQTPEKEKQDEQELKEDLENDRDDSLGYSREQFTHEEEDPAGPQPPEEEKE